MYIISFLCFKDKNRSTERSPEKMTDLGKAGYEHVAILSGKVSYFTVPLSGVH